MKSLLCVRLAVLLLISMSSMALSQTESRPRTVVPGDIIALMQAKDAVSLEDKISVLKTAPLYQRLWLAQQLSEFLGDNAELTLAGYQMDPNTHNLKRAKGRAAHAIEKLTGMQLGASPQHETKEDLEAQKKSINLFLNSQKNERRKAQTKTVRTLKEAYSGKVKTGLHDNALKSARAMLDLFDEWFPLGESPDALTDILGIQGSKTDKGLTYSFDDGFTVFNIQLLLDTEDGTIEWVMCDTK